MTQILTTNPVWKRLLAPAGKVGFEELEQDWHQESISVRIQGYGALASHDRLLFKLRGAIGEALFRGASPEAVAGKLCPWNPPCACDVFYTQKPFAQMPSGRQVVPKPFVLSCEARRQDLILHVTVFGFANEWQAEVRAAILTAVRELIPWELLAEGLFVPSEKNIAVETTPLPLKGADGVALDSVTLEFVTPFDCSHFDPLEAPQKLLLGMANRIALLARWQDKRLETNWEHLSQVVESLEYKFVGSSLTTIKRRSRRGNRSYNTECRTFELVLSGDLTWVISVLSLGEAAHVGGGASFGLGRFKILRSF